MKKQPMLVTIGNDSLPIHKVKLEGEREGSNIKWARVLIGADSLAGVVEDLQQMGIGQDDAQLFPARALEAVKQHIYEVEYAPTRARELIPASSEKGQWITEITFREFDKTGFAKVMTSLADDAPIVNIRGKEFTVKVKPIRAAYQYTVDEIAQAAHANVPLLTRDSQAVVEAMEQEIESLAWYGDANLGLPGLLYNPNITAAYVAVGAGSGTTPWAGKTNDEIYADMVQAVSTPEDITNGVEVGLDTVCLPIAQYNLIRSRRMASGTDTTILEFFLNNNPGVKVEKLIWLKDMPSVPSTGAVKVVADHFCCMLAYKRDPLKLSLEIPMDFTQFPPQERNLAFVVNCMLHYAGVLIYRPLSVYLAEGI